MSPTRDDLRRSQARAVSRLGGAYMLRAFMATAAAVDHDYLAAVVYSAIVQTNIAQLNDDPELSARYASLDAIVPDELRRPISVHALAASLHIPYETTRRCVSRLIEKGMVRRTTRSGIIATAEAIADPANVRAVEQNYTDVMRLIAQLRRHGITLDGV